MMDHGSETGTRTERHGKVGLLLLHGFSRSNREQRLIEIQEALSSTGIIVRMPLLPGHGTVPGDLNTVTWKDWLTCAQQELGELQKQVDTVFVGGFSMGGNIAFLLAQSHPVAGIISFATPFILRPRWRISLRFILAFSDKMQWMKKLVTKRAAQHVSPEIVQRKDRYWTYPIKSLGDLYKIILESKGILSAITTPTLIIQPHGIPLHPAQNADYIYATIGSPIKKIVQIDNSYIDTMTEDIYNKQEIFDEIRSFIHHQCPHAHRNL